MYKIHLTKFELLKQSMIKLLIFTSLLLLVNCHDRPMPEDCEEYDYSDCITLKPDFGLLIIKLTSSDTINPTIISVYKGYFEERNLIFSDTTTAYSLIYEMNLNEYYTVTAFYKTPEKDILAIDGDKIRLFEYPVCDSICYVVENAVIDLRINH